jgi:hypothetical protein
MNVWLWWDIEIRTLDGDGENLVGALMVGKHYVVKTKIGNFGNIIFIILLNLNLSRFQIEQNSLQCLHLDI